MSEENYGGFNVFVYGSLRFGQPNHDHYLLDTGSTIVADDVTLPRKGIMFHMGNFPGITLIEPLTPIKGEIYHTDKKVIESLDRLENHPNFYKRIQLYIPPYGYCWAYELTKGYCNSEKYIVSDGDWKGPTLTTKRALWYGWGKGGNGVPPAQGAASPFVEEATVNLGLAAESGQVFRTLRTGKENTFFLLNVTKGTKHGPFECNGWTQDDKTHTSKPIISPPISKVVQAIIGAAGDTSKTLYLPAPTKPAEEKQVEATNEEVEEDDDDPFYEQWTIGPGATAP